MRTTFLCLVLFGCDGAAVVQTEQLLVVGGGDATCLSKEVSFVDKGTIKWLDYSFQDVPLTPSSGYHRFTVEGPGFLVMKSRQFEPSLAMEGAAFERQTRPDINGAYVSTRVAAGRFTVVATSTANLAGCPTPASDGLYTISLE